MVLKGFSNVSHIGSTAKYRGKTHRYAVPYIITMQGHRNINKEHHESIYTVYTVHFDLR